MSNYGWTLRPTKMENARTNTNIGRKMSDVRPLFQALITILNCWFSESSPNQNSLLKYYIVTSLFQLTLQPTYLGGWRTYSTKFNAELVHGSIHSVAQLSFSI